MPFLTVFLSCMPFGNSAPDFDDTIAYRFIGVIDQMAIN
jgi:hypothetical protein